MAQITFGLRVAQAASRVLGEYVFGALLRDYFNLGAVWFGYFILCRLLSRFFLLVFLLLLC